MNMVERTTELGKSLYEINNSTVSEMAELSRKNVEQYFDVNRSFGEKLPEVTEVSAFFSLQREYGETLWNNAREAMEAQNAIWQNAMNETREVFQGAFTTEQTAPAAKPAAKKSAKKAKAA